jgi:hypothetical protein
VGGGRLGLGARGSSSTWADCSRMKPQFAHVSGNASMPRSTAALPAACSSATRSSQPCHSSAPQNGHVMRAPRLRKKSKIRFVASPYLPRQSPDTLHAIGARMPTATPRGRRRRYLPREVFFFVFGLAGRSLPAATARAFCFFVAKVLPSSLAATVLGSGGHRLERRDGLAVPRRSPFDSRSGARETPRGRPSPKQRRARRAGTSDAPAAARGSSGGASCGGCC